MKWGQSFWGQVQMSLSPFFYVFSIAKEHSMCYIFICTK